MMKMKECITTNDIIQTDDDGKTDDMLQRVNELFVNDNTGHPQLSHTNDTSTTDYISAQQNTTVTAPTLSSPANTTPPSMMTRHNVHHCHQFVVGEELCSQVRKELEPLLLYSVECLYHL